MPESSRLGRENIYRGDDKATVLNHLWYFVHVNDIFIETTKAEYPTVKTEKNKSTFEQTTMILGMSYRHGPNNMNLVANLGNVLRNTHPKKGKKAFSPGRVSYFVGDDGRPGTQIVVEEKSDTSVDIQMVGREAYTNSDKIPRKINKISLTISENPLENAIAITQADIAKILHLIEGMQKDMKHKEYNVLRYKLLARSILGLMKLYADDAFLQKQQDLLNDIHNPKALNEKFGADAVRSMFIGKYSQPIYDKYNTYLDIIPSQYILLPDDIKKDFDFFVHASRDMYDKTHKIKDICMDRVKGVDVDQSQTIELLDNIHLNLVQRNSRFHTILQDMCKHPELQKRLQVFDY